MVCMAEDTTAKKILSERLKMLANICQTLGVGVLLLGIVAPLVDSGQNALGRSDAVAAGAIALILIVIAQRLIGDSVRMEP
jgi:uncharacterized membrane protein YjfL (UPF0719 family)